MTGDSTGRPPGRTPAPRHPAEPYPPAGEPDLRDLEAVTALLLG
ncbi:MAG TPA: hypothetical protein VM324_14160 [Egibacteraceae bacterium]|nr:hypothetical protein [Egibacteraceae bacterium]